jgi:FAD synthetase
MPATAGIVIIGDEILTGKFADQNAQFLIGELRRLGVDLRRVTILPDDRDEIGEVVAWFSRQFDHVFTSGGVGPTHDDVTMAGIAHGFATRVVVHPDLEAKVRAYWGPTMPEANVRLAEVPDGAVLVYGKDSTWPVVSYRNVYILPGVPSLFKRKFLDIADRFRATPVTIARVYASSDEGLLAPHLDAVVAAFPAVKLGSYPRFDEREFRVLLTLEGADPAAVAAAQTDLVDRLGAMVVRTDSPRAAGPDV